MGICCHSKEEVVKNKESTSEENFLSEYISNMQKTKKTHKRIIAVALFPFQCNNKLLLNFERGDQLIIEDDSDPDWYLARHAYEGERRFVRKSYLSLEPSRGEESWLFGDISRDDAERLLFHPDNEYNAFLVRHGNEQGSYALSLKDIDAQTNKTWIPHFKIRALDKGGFLMSEKEPFDILKDLVAHYSKDTKGEHLKLNQPCLRPRKLDPLPDSRDELEIPLDSLEFVRTLGKGKFGRVSFGIWNDAVDVAIKIFDLKSVLRREAAFMKALSHHKIVHLYAICTETEPFCIVMENMPNGDLLHYLKTDIGKKLQSSELVDISAQVAEGMMYLEANNVIHGDLKAKNILVVPYNTVKLANFEHARIADEAASSGENLPVEWTAQKSLPIKSDVLSFGMLLYEIFTHGRSPYSGMKNTQVTELIRKHGYRLLKPSDPECNDAVYDIMTMCWKKEPEDRPTFEFLHHFFEDFPVTSETPKREAKYAISSD